MVTLKEILQLPVLHGARLVAGQQGLENPVRWCHVAEVLDIARLLAGGELLLTTGLALGVPPDRQQMYVQDLQRRGVAGLMLELGRQFEAVPPALAGAADAVGLPLITLPFDTPFVGVTEAVHTLVLTRRNPQGVRPRHAGPAAEQVMEDLITGRLADGGDLVRQLQGLGIAVMEQPWLAVLVADTGVGIVPGHVSGAAEGGRLPYLLRSAGSEVQLLAFGPNRSVLAKALRSLAHRLAPAAAGVGRCYREPQAAARSLVEARQTMRLRRSRPELDPLFEETGVYSLALSGGGREELEQFTAAWLEPLLQYDRVHRADLLGTLRVLLDDGLIVAEAARRLHLTRQALYHRRERITELLGRDLDDPEVRLALAVALRVRDVVAVDGDDGRGIPK